MAEEKHRVGELDPEFPEGADAPPGMSRREWLKLLGSSFAFAGLSGCNVQRVEGILPYVEDPEDVEPGNPRSYATSMVLDGSATGLLVRSWAGRPTKVEGNPAHPASLGATGVLEQASILDLYDPNRAQGIRHNAGSAAWEAFAQRFSAARPDRGAGLRFLLLPSSSLVVSDLLGRLLDRHPEARFTFWSPAMSDAPWQGAELAFGKRLQPQRDFSVPRVILSLDADFLDCGPFHVRYARQFAARRRIASPSGEMNRLYVAEPALSTTGTMADHRLALRPSEIPYLAAAVVAELALLPNASAPAAVLAALTPLRAEGEARARAEAIARDLARAPGEGLIVAGDSQPPVVHALAHLGNALLRSGRAAWVTDPTLLHAGPAEQALPDLAADLQARRVDTLVIAGANPSYSAPPELELSRWIRAVPDSIYLGLHENETAADCRWFIPMTHYLEEWDGALAWDGTISTVQPLLRPLFGGRTPGELLAVFTGEIHPDARALVREAFQRRHRGGGDFERSWAAALRAGLARGSALPRLEPTLDEGRLVGAISALATAPRPPAPDAAGEGPGGAQVEAVFAPDPRVHDGRFANNTWLQELPDPITKLTWDNAALMSAGTARKLGVQAEDMVELELGGRRARMPVLIAPGHVDGAVTLRLGYGRHGTEQIALGVGVDVYPLRQGGASFLPGMVIRKADAPPYPLALTQTHWRAQGRPIAPAVSLPLYRERADFTAHLKGPLPSLLPPVEAPVGNPSGEQWAMTIDTTICTGCSACVVACQAENNILVVGKEGVRKSREMHWLRIDTYYSGELSAPEVVHQPMLCQHCEKAPCEYVCPVNATVHSPDGLNEMVYNRCVGTRFCSNNCPYKVRRFNYFDYPERAQANNGLARLQRNPDVTVRERGVMEKCTFCVQRIRRAGIEARTEGRPIRPGEVVTACAQACPTGAIQFASLNHRDSLMVAWREEPRSYAVLHELGTRPRTMYLARINNPRTEVG